MSNETQIQEFESLRTYIKFLCKQKGMKMRDMERSLDIPIGSVVDNLDRCIGSARTIKIISFLDGDFNIAMDLMSKNIKK